MPFHLTKVMPTATILMPGLAIIELPDNTHTLKDSNLWAQIEVSVLNHVYIFSSRLHQCFILMRVALSLQLFLMVVSRIKENHFVGSACQSLLILWFYLFVYFKGKGQSRGNRRDKSFSLLFTIPSFCLYFFQSPFPLCFIFPLPANTCLPLASPHCSNGNQKSTESSFIKPCRLLLGDIKPFWLV